MKARDVGTECTRLIEEVHSQLGVAVDNCSQHTVDCVGLDHEPAIAADKVGEHPREGHGDGGHHSANAWRLRIRGNVSPISAQLSPESLLKTTRPPVVPR